MTVPTTLTEVETMAAKILAAIGYEPVGIWYQGRGYSLERGSEFMLRLVAKDRRKKRARLAPRGRR